MLMKNLVAEPYAPLAKEARRAAADGCVLLKNEGRVLPLSKSETVSFFGRTQIDYLKSGTGSGGLVHTEYTVNIIEGALSSPHINVNTELLDIYKAWIEKNPFDVGHGWATEPWFQKEYVPEDSVVKRAREISDVAVIVIGRTAGEDRDNAAERGSWYLTEEEEALLEVVSKYFERTAVLLNVGNVIDMSWVEKYDIKAVMYVWQGGQEGGNAVADVLSGRVSPSGRLADTIAKDINDYPSTENFGGKSYNLYCEDIYVGYRYFETFAKDRVLYPFGYGLSYTDFEITAERAEKRGERICLSVSVRNTGDVSGREVVQVYFEAPQGRLGKSKRSLCAFAKTDVIVRGEAETVSFEFDISSLASYDDSGATENKSCYVLEEGEYHIYVGKNVRDAECVLSFDIDALTVTERLSETLAPERAFDVLYPGKDLGPTLRPASLRHVDYEARIEAERPDALEYTGDRGIKLADVKNGKNDMSEFIAQLSDDDLIYLSIGEGMSSPKARPGNTGVFGGVTDELQSFGIPVACVEDGPSGIRMDNGDTATSLPNGTLIACTWDMELASRLYEYVGIELYTHDIDALLGPGVNIHRSPLNGRNFEYLSEDPYLTGMMGAALVSGIRRSGGQAVVKHFAANSQEFSRRDAVSVISERALREIYLKPFEICVKRGGCEMIMTSYNPVNEHWTAVNYDLNTVILRREWGYGGMVVSDWWPKMSSDEEETDIHNLGDMIIAQNDVYMLAESAIGLKTNAREALESGVLTRGQLQRNAANILRVIMGMHTLERFSTVGAQSVGLRERIDELSVVLEHTSPISGEHICADVPFAERVLVAIDYRSDMNGISQLVIELDMNGKRAASTTVSGTDGDVRTALFEVPLGSSVSDIALRFPSALCIDRIRILK